jgi:chromosome segregation ATPase
MEDNTPQLASCEAAASRLATSLRELEDRARSAVGAQRAKMARLEDDITSKLDAIVAAIGDQSARETDIAKAADEAQAEIERLRKDAEDVQAAWQLDKDRQQAELEAVRAELKTLNAALAEYDERAKASTTQRVALEQERDGLLKKIAGLESQLDAEQQKGQQQRAGLEQQIGERQSSWDKQRAAWEENRIALEHQRDELKQKFDLALADVQRLRGRVAELEQDLARRPETERADSAELVALRAERDALAERVEELERQPAPPVDADSEQQLADLQRRFEMAVEDVRELKTKNAELESRLAARPARSPNAADSGAMDWESQKRRLLASLEDASEGDEPLPEKERISIQDTIEMTDAVVAEKDREIERLKAELVETSQVNADSGEVETSALLDADEVIAEHRKRIAQLEREMEDKLRAAELELSVERAKIAREKVELEEQRSDLEARRHSAPAGGAGAAPGGTPRRRWLSKLGITGDE